MKRGNQFSLVLLIFTMMLSLLSMVGSSTFAVEDVSVFNKAYIPSIGTGKLDVLNLTDNTIEQGKITVGKGPVSAAISPDGKYVFVSNYKADSISVIDPVTETVLRTLDSDFDDPMGIVFNSDGSKAYIANNDNNTIGVVNTSTWAQSTIEVGNTTACLTTIGNDLYVTSWATSDLYKIDMTTDVVSKTLDIGGSNLGIAANLEGTKLYIAGADGNLKVIDLSTFSLEESIDIGMSLTGIDISPDGKKIYMIDREDNKCYIVNVADYTEKTSVAIGNEAYGLGIQGDYAYVLNMGNDNISVISLASNTVVDTIITSPGPVAFGTFMLSTRMYSEVSAYDVTVDSLTGGSISPSITTSGAGTVVTVVVSPDSGMQLKTGSLKYIYNDGSHAIIGSSFVMPSSDVTITAEFEAIPVTTYNVSVDSLTGGSISPSITTSGAGTVVTVVVSPDSGMQLKTGSLKYTYNDGSHAIIGSSFVMPSSDVIITADFENIPTKKNSKSRSSRSSSTNTTESNTPIKETTSVINKKNAITDVDVTGKMNAKVTVTDREVLIAVASAVKTLETKDENTTQNVEIIVASAGKIDSVETIVSKASMNALSKTNEAVELKIKTSFGEIIFDHKAINTIAQTNEDIKIIISDVEIESLSKEVQELVSDHAVFNFSVIAGGKKISNFNGNLTVSLSYMLKEGEESSGVVVYYIDSDGNVKTVNRSVYDSAQSVVRFRTTHFSQYAIGYNAIDFRDVSPADWHCDAVRFVSSRNITIKSDEEAFYPDEKLTRGEFLVMLMKAYDLNALENEADNFDDAGNAYYTGYLANAKEIGVTKGVGNNLFLPDTEISRQEMVSFLYNVLKKIDELPINHSGQLFDTYLDVNELAPWAHDSMESLVECGIVNSNANLLLPNKLLTRAEGAQVIFDLLSKRELK